MGNSRLTVAGAREAFFVTLTDRFARSAVVAAGADTELFVTLTEASVDMAINVFRQREHEGNSILQDRREAVLRLASPSATASYSVGPFTLEVLYVRRHQDNQVDVVLYEVDWDEQEISPSDLVPVEVIAGSGVLDYRKAVEPVLGRAQQLLHADVIDDPAEAELLRTSIEWLQARAMLGDLDSPLTAASAAGVFYELAALVAKYDRAPDDPAIGTVQAAAIEAISSHRPDDPEIVGDIADAVEQATGGRVKRRVVLQGVASGSMVTGAAALVADVGVYKASIAGGAGLVTSILVVLALTFVLGRGQG